jgi:transcriptional regulator NrdR family protein
MKQIIKDLIRKDSLETEMKVCNDNSILYRQNIQSKDFIISIKNDEIKAKDSVITNLNSAIGKKDIENQNLQKNIDDLNVLLKKANKKVITRTVVGGAIIASLTYLLLKH